MKELEELVAKLRDACNRNTRVLGAFFKETLPDLKRRLDALEQREKLRSQREKLQERGGPLGGFFGQ